MDLVQNLESLGLNKTEAKIYLALLELGESRVGPLCDKLDITNSHVYRYLDSLMKLGLVSFKISNNTKVFMASDPENLESLFSRKKKELQEQEKAMRAAIPKLKELPKQRETISDYKYYEGIKGIRSLWNEMNDLLIPESEASYYTGTLESWDVLNGFYLAHHKTRASKKVHLRMILPKGAVKQAEQRKQIGYFDYKLADIEKDGEFGVYENFIVIQYTSKKESNPRGFLIKDPIFVETYREIFNKLWEQVESS